MKNDGEQVTLSGNFVRGVKITVANETIQLVPPVKWYEILLSILPFILVMVWGNSVELCKIVPIVGGAIGGGISGLMMFTNLIVIKRVNKLWLKILISLGMLVATFIICWAIACAILAAI